MIIRDITLETRNNKSKPSEDIFIYFGDYNIQYNIKIATKYSISDSSMADGFNSGNAEIILFKKFGDIIKTITKNVQITDGVVPLIIDSTVSDELSDIGYWMVQISLFNEGSTSKLTLPPFKMQVLPLINSGGDIQ